MSKRSRRVDADSLPLLTGFLEFCATHPERLPLGPWFAGLSQNALDRISADLEPLVRGPYRAPKALAEYVGVVLALWGRERQLPDSREIDFREDEMLEALAGLGVMAGLEQARRVGALRIHGEMSIDPHHNLSLEAIGPQQTSP